MTNENSKNQIEIKMDEFQDFYERHFDKDNLEQRKEILNIVNKAHIEQAYWQAKNVIDKSLQTQAVLTFVRTALKEYGLAGGGQGTNRYMKVRFGDDIKDVYWNPYGKYWSGPNG